MKKSTILGVALGLAALTSIGSAGMALAQQSSGREHRESQGDYGRDDNRDSDRRNQNGDWDRGNGYGDWNRGNNAARNFIGVWRLDQRGSRQGPHGEWGSASRNRLAQLPSVIRIERDRRELRVENSNGRLLREIDLRGGDARNGQIQVVSTGYGGMRVVETFTLRDRGRELVVHTTVQGRRGSQHFTSIYDRA